jgi:succinate-semialdehyde dehydrogenase/glutarate-semialdehyde dehydrogenase
VTARSKQVLSRAAATGEAVGAVPATAPEAVAGVVEDVAQVQRFWGQLGLGDRARYLRRAAQAVLDMGDELALLIAREQGRPRTEAYLTEVLPTVDALRTLAELGPRALADERIPTAQVLLKAKRLAYTYDPLGVIGVIGSWSSPWSSPLQDVASALMAGNGVVVKPSSVAPLTGERVAETFARAGVPEGIVRVVHGPSVGTAVVESPVAKVLFSGSIETGRHVGLRCAELLKGSVLKLAGKDPMIVLGDADMAHTTAGALWAAYANAGQGTASVKRAYVLPQVADRFLAGVVAGALRLRVGDPLDPRVEVGPLATPASAKRLRELVDDAVERGAALACGGPLELQGISGPFFAPAVLTDVPHDAALLREEAPGPVLAVATVRDIDEAVRLANHSPFGLGASVWTRDRAKGERVARELQAGMVWLNDHGFTHGAGQAPWGGVKDSGLGRSHGRAGLLECSNVKLRAWDPGRVRAPWWHPYDETLVRAAREAAHYLYGREADRPRALRRGALPLLSIARRLARDAVRR